MSEPLMLLIMGSVTIVTIILLFYPNKGIIATLKRTKYANKKVLIEDALKYLYNCEYNQTYCTLNSIAGNLSISADEATDIITKLESLGLVNAEKNELELTSDGRSYALRVIRVHRLWEKYLADEVPDNPSSFNNLKNELICSGFTSDGSIIFLSFRKLRNAVRSFLYELIVLTERFFSSFK